MVKFLVCGEAEDGDGIWWEGRRRRCSYISMGFGHRYAALGWILVGTTLTHLRGEVATTSEVEGEKP